MNTSTTPIRHFLSYFVILVFLVLLMWFGWWWWINTMSGEQAARGQIGDAFGGINALFSALALAGVVTAVILQSQELHEQRVEMRRASEAHEGSVAALTTQIELAAISALLTSVNEQLNAEKGRENVEAYLRQLRRAYHGRFHNVLESMGRPIKVPPADPAVSDHLFGPPNA